MASVYSWTQPICDGCWLQRWPERVPVRLREPDREQCAICGSATESGIYCRIDPATVAFPRRKFEDPLPPER
jgi:hypothetical protein